MKERRTFQRAARLLPRHLKNCKVLPDRTSIYHEVPHGGIVAEVGVFAGDNAQNLLKLAQPAKLVLVDTFKSSDNQNGRFTRDNHREYICNRFQSEIEDGLVQISQGLSWEKMSEFRSDTFDLIYIDAGHSYDEVKRDLEASQPKLKPDGLLVLNDYIFFDHVLQLEYGVVQATNEFCLERGYEFIFFALHNQMYCDVAIRKISNDSPEPSCP